MVDNICNNYKNKDILTLSQFDTSSVETIFKRATEIKQTSDPKDLLKILEGKVITLLFYEPSSRTRGSFDAAAQRLGARTLVINVEASSVAKGETLEDTIKTFANYSDAIVLRHAEVGAAVKASEISDVPVFNAGDGVGEHPTQALLDMFTIFEKKKTLSGLKGVFGGDMKNGRTVHSLLKGLSLFENNEVVLLSPPQLKLDEILRKSLEKKGLKITQTHRVENISKDATFWYWTRVQKERFSNLEDYEKVKHAFVITSEFLNKYAGEDTILMHPLPRVGEITTDVDADPRAIYLTNQMQNGMYVRMALLKLVLNS